MELDNEKIAVRAYQLSQERIGKGRAPLDDWLKAEWELKNYKPWEIEEDTSSQQG
jgi:hypothetical protein